MQVVSSWRMRCGQVPEDTTLHLSKRIQGDRVRCTLARSCARRAASSLCRRRSSSALRCASSAARSWIKCISLTSGGIRQVQGGSSPHQISSGCFSPHQLRSPWLDSCQHLCALRSALQLPCIVHDALRYFSCTLLRLRTHVLSVRSF